MRRSLGVFVAGMLLFAPIFIAPEAENADVKSLAIVPVGVLNDLCLPLLPCIDLVDPTTTTTSPTTTSSTTTTTSTTTASSTTTTTAPTTTTSLVTTTSTEPPTTTTSRAATTTTERRADGTSATTTTQPPAAPTTTSASTTTTSTVLVPTALAGGPPSGGLRDTETGIQADYRTGLFGDMDDVEVMGVELAVDYRIASEVIESSWVWMLGLSLMIAVAIVTGLERRASKLT